MQRYNEVVSEEDLRVTLMTNKRQRNDNNDLNENLINEYVIDSGCTQSVLCNKEHIHNYQPYQYSMSTADSGVLQCIGKGDLLINSQLTIKGVLHCPKVSMNLISSSQVCDQGYTMHIDKENIYIKKQKIIALRADRYGDLYIFRISPKQNHILALEGSARTELAHRRCGHLNLPYLRLLSHLSEGLILDKDPTQICTVCSQTKATRASFAPSQSQASRIGELTHCDICSVGVPTIIGQCLMFLVLVDDATRWVTIFLLAHKDDAIEQIMQYARKIKNFTSRPLGILQCDNGGEFINGTLQEYCTEEGIHIRTSTAYTPEQNGRAERINRTILEGTSSLLLDCQLPFSYWGFAAEAFVYVKNRSPHAKLHRSTPYENWYRKLPDLTNLHVFGFKCYVHIPKETRRTLGPGNKLIPKARPMIFVGYSETKKAWKCFDPITKTIHESIHVRFDDESTPINGVQSDIPSLLSQMEPLTIQTPNEETSEIGEQFQQYDLPELGENLFNSEISSKAMNNENERQSMNNDNEFNANEQIDELSQSLNEAITQNERAQATPLAVPHNNEVQPEVVYKSSAGKWMIIEESSKPVQWDPTTLPKAGTKRNRKQKQGYAESLVSSADDQNQMYNLALSIITTPLSQISLHIRKP